MKAARTTSSNAQTAAHKSGALKAVLVALSGNPGITAGQAVYFQPTYVQPGYYADEQAVYVQQGYAQPGCYCESAVSGDIALAILAGGLIS